MTETELIKTSYRKQFAVKIDFSELNDNAIEHLIKQLRGAKLNHDL